MRKKLSPEEIEGRRRRNYHLLPELAVRSEEAARDFVDEVGLCFLFPVAGAELPNLWEAVNGGRRELPRRNFDHLLRMTWNWKDTLPSKRQVFYAKLIRQKPTLVSLSLLPCFYALSDNYGEPDDYLESYRQGRMSEEAKRIYEILLERGPSSTGALRREASLWGWHNSTRFERALRELQAGLKIAKCGISDANRWGYSYVYDLLPRFLPEEVARGLETSSRQGMRMIMTKYIETVVAATPQQVARLFGWSPERTKAAADSLLDQGTLVEAEVSGEEGWLAMA